tara:strand:- start:1946 stop:2635 length:690 start_codon:yes stop_codon:yes gene_type:complete
MVLISISNLSLIYDGLRITNPFRLPERLRFKALEIDDFGIRDGEIVALMGHNGAGKSTLLNSIAGKMRPTEGEITVEGTIIHLSGVDPGFDPNLSPRQNILWLSKIYTCDSERVISSVEEFSDIGEAFDRPIRTLSGGMRGRVGFGFATSLEPQILLIDEVLGVGDPSFKAKATRRLEEMMKRTGIVLISTHSVGLVKSIASRVSVLEKGSLIHDGDVEEGLAIYSSIK